MLFGSHAVDLVVKFCKTLSNWNDMHQAMYTSIRDANETLSVAKSSLILAILTHS